MATTLMPSTSNDKNEDKKKEEPLIGIMILGVLITVFGAPLVCGLTLNKLTQKCNLFASGIVVLVGVGLMTYAGIKLNKKKDDY